MLMERGTTNMVDFINNDDTRMVEMMFDTGAMIERFDQLGLLDQEISEDYGKNVTDMCNIATAYMGHFLTTEFGVDLKVHEGVFGMIGNHTWMSIEDFIIDPTLAQFMSSSPEIAFVPHGTEEYQAVRTFFFDEWIAQLEE